MKKLITLTIIFVCPLFLFAQGIIIPTEIKRNSIYGEVFGQGLYNSISFDRLYHTERKVKTSLSAGITFLPLSYMVAVATPVSYNYIFGQKNHHLELGLGFTPMYFRSKQIEATDSYSDKNGIIHNESFIGHETDFFSYFTPKIGYRFQKPNGGLFFRATFSPAVAGINKYGSLKGGNYKLNDSYSEYFSSAAFFGSPVFPWAGVSIGWTMKK